MCSDAIRHSLVAAYLRVLDHRHSAFRALISGSIAMGHRRLAIVNRHRDVITRQYEPAITQDSIKVRHPVIKHMRLVKAIVNLLPCFGVECDDLYRSVLPDAIARSLSLVNDDICFRIGRGNGHVNEEYLRDLYIFHFRFLTNGILPTREFLRAKDSNLRVIVLAIGNYKVPWQRFLLCRPVVVITIRPNRTRFNVNVTQRRMKACIILLQIANSLFLTCCNSNVVWNMFPGLVGQLSKDTRHKGKRMCSIKVLQIRDLATAMAVFYIKQVRAASSIDRVNRAPNATHPFHVRVLVLTLSTVSAGRNGRQVILLIDASLPRPIA